MTEFVLHLYHPLFSSIFFFPYKLFLVLLCPDNTIHIAFCCSQFLSLAFHLPLNLIILPLSILLSNGILIHFLQKANYLNKLISVTHFCVQSTFIYFYRTSGQIYAPMHSYFILINIFFRQIILPFFIQKTRTWISICLIIPILSVFVCMCVKLDTRTFHLLFLFISLIHSIYRLLSFHYNFPYSKL